jgi:CBS domain containing-hemolysin-like protein
MTDTHEQVLSANEDEYDEDEAELDDIVRAKWLIDGSATLEEAAERLEAAAKEFRAAHAAGFQLRQSIDDDYGFVFHPDGRRLYPLDEDADADD